MMRDVKIVTLCGSSKFKEDFEIASKEITLAGDIVISLGLWGHLDPEIDMTSAVKDMLDRNHRIKIDHSEAIFVVNPRLYIGESTAGEIEYAKQTGKPVYYMYDDTGRIPYV